MTSSPSSYSSPTDTCILHEFQDTNLDEWQMISALGKHSRLIAIAGAEQRIYEFRGADPARIGAFIERFKLKSFDFEHIGLLDADPGPAASA